MKHQEESDKRTRGIERIVNRNRMKQKVELDEETLEREKRIVAMQASKIKSYDRCIYSDLICHREESLYDLILF